VAWRYIINAFPTWNTSPVRCSAADIDASYVRDCGNCNAVVTGGGNIQVSGNIVHCFADYNTKVTKNQLVARIDPTIFQAKVIISAPR